MIITILLFASRAYFLQFARGGGGETRNREIEAVLAKIGGGKAAIVALGRLF
jgi:hypothetical protein